MSIFPEDLTPEEELSQFTPNEVDNEVFAIEQFGGVYPGNIPNYNENTFLNSMNDNREMWNVVSGEQFDIETEPEPSAEEAQTYNIDDSANDETVDAPEDLNTEELETSEAEDLTEEPEYNDIIEPEEQATDVDFDNAETEDEEITVDESSQASDVQSITSIDDIFNLDSENLNTPAETESNENIALDDNTITAETNETTVEPEEADITPPEDENAEEIDTSDIEEAEVIGVTEDSPTGGADLIDDDLRNMLLNDLENTTAPEQAPSASVEYSSDIPKDDFSSDDGASNIEEVAWDSSTEEFQIKQKLKNNDNSADNETNAEKNGKMTEEEKNNNTKKFILIAAITVAVLILAIGGIIGYLYLSSKSNIPTETNNAKHEQTTDSTANTASKSLPDYAATDTTQADTQTVLEPKPDTTAETPLEALIEAPPASRINKPAVAPKPVAQSKPTVALQPKPAQKAPPVVAPPKENEVVNALYVVQIYSSLSKSDAEERLSILTQKNVKGYISTQQIKGQTWYRVRFGNYSNYEEAVVDASRLGLNDVWIERVK